MDAQALTAIDWREPAFAPYAAFREPFEATDWRSALNRRARSLDVRTHAGALIEFVGAADAADVPYEAHIAATGRVPTRDNLHDRFNALVWLAFPKLKARLNALQAEAIARAGAAARRGPVRDAATIFDENGLLLVGIDNAVFEHVRIHAWDKLFLESRSMWPAQVRPIVFGHALLEKLIEPYKALTAHALAINLDARAPDTAIDALGATLLTADLSTRALLPIPVLGIPGWSSANENPDFYADASVFRPARPPGDFEESASSAMIGAAAFSTGLP